MSLIILAACGGSEDPSKTLETVSSWTATSEMVTRAWLAGAVPTTYASRTLKTLREEIRAERKKLAGKPLADSAAVFQVLATVDTTIAHASRALLPENALTINRIADELEADGQTLDQLVQREKARSGQ
jgi:hypothetical protein